MTRDDIIRMAREAGFELTMWQLSFGYEACGTHETFERFAGLIEAAERDACAKVCDELADDAAKEQDFHALAAAESCAEEIRSRGQ